MPLPRAVILSTAILILDVGHKQFNDDILVGCLYLSEGYNTLLLGSPIYALISFSSADLRES